MTKNEVLKKVSELSGVTQKDVDAVISAFSDVVVDTLADNRDETVSIGTPYVEGATVEAKVEKHDKQKKIIVYHYLPKKKSHKKQGHRQPYTKLTITKINA